MMNKEVDVIYVVASKLGSIGMGSAAYNAIKGIDNSKRFSYKIFCRGYNNKVEINKKNINSYGYLEYLSYPFRFLEKKFKMNINSFKLVNKIFGRKIYKNMPKCKIYHTWMGIAPEAAKKAKKEKSILVLEAANSHPMNSSKILNEEFKRFNREKFSIDSEKMKKDMQYMKIFDYILCPSDFVYDSFLKEGFEKNRLIKFPYGVDINKFNIKKEKNDKKFRAVFVGSVQLRKGIQYLLKAWNELKLKNAELIIVGSIYPDATKVIKKYSNNTIKFENFSPNLNDYYKKSDIFIFPSIEEGSALVNYEAMASGLPIITTFNSGSVARDGKDGFIIPIRDVNSLKKKIKYFYNNPQEIKKMGKSARKQVENYTWKNYGENLSEIYKKL
jgi:glycosyltransferase involved in cell wall biosynthesis